MATYLFSPKGFVKSEVEEVNSLVLCDRDPIMSKLIIRYKEDGIELNRTSITCTLHKNSREWKVAALMLYEADNVLEMC